MTLDVFAYGLASVLVVSAISLVGILAIPAKSKNLIYPVSFAAGGLFGDSFIHLLPQTIEMGFTGATPVYILSGIVTMFVVEKIIHWHHSHGRPGPNAHIKPFVFMNLIGDGVHNFIDGLVIGASYLVNVPLGVATTLAVVFHEIPQEIGDFGVLLKGGVNRGKAIMLNLFSALAAVAGFLVSMAISGYIEGFVSIMVPFTIGSFVYIAGSDLIPELHKEKSDKSAMQLLSFVAGIAVMYLLLLVE
ncbi:MAG: ZIP family metal transporter [Candidatus Aenigmarchaeota archaeon]|nr:ZIP family metal transporter [Candidatus Aenigmarchaeota archaeon]